MKKFISIIATVLCCILVFSFVACNNQGGENPTPNHYTRPSNANVDDSFTPTSKTLVAYFSKTNTTKGVAEAIQEYTGADIFEIERKEPYPDAYTPTTEEAQDEKNANARPELSLYLPDEVMAQYDTIILGFPIWWHTAPMPVLSFLNYYDLSGKTIYTFCTSGGSAISESTADVRNNAEGATVVEGRRFSGGEDGAIETWLNGIGLLSASETPNVPEQPEQPEQNSILIVYFSPEYGNTERVANYIHSRIGGDIVEIEAAVPYTAQDLNYSIPNNRPEVEKAENARPEIAQSTYNAIDMSKYDTVFIGYPIWWWTAPMIVGTFLEHYDFTGFDIYPFSQSASMNTAQFNTSMEFVRESAAKMGAPTVHEGLFTKSNSVVDTYLSNNGFDA